VREGHDADYPNKNLKEKERLKKPRRKRNTKRETKREKRKT
jgi:hypothetical protein